MIGAALALLGGAGSLVSGLPFLGAVLQFLGTRAGKFTIAGLAGLIVISTAYFKGEAHATRRCEDKALRAQVAALNRTIVTLNGRAERSDK